MIWDDCYTQYLKARRSTQYAEAIKQFMPTALQALASISPEDTEWLIKALHDGRKKWFVQLLFERVDTLPDALFMPLVQASVYEQDPSYNRDFVRPCIKVFGQRRVSEALLDLVATGTNFEKAGAVNALYWALGSPNAELQDLYLRRQYLFLQEFVSNHNRDVRRSIIPQLELDSQQYPEHLIPLVEEAIHIASKHPDSYIRHRVKVQLGQTRLLEPLPHRKNTERKSLFRSFLDRFSFK